jgi:tellurite methyltransferase
MSDKKSKYWDEYYGALKSSNEGHMPPSQFAAFCRAELMQLNIYQLTEIASGDGRDSIFFAQQGLHIVALDKSVNAVDLLKNKASLYKRLSVEKIDVVDGIFPAPDFQDSACAYYARFFIHTLDEKQLFRFFKNLSKAMGQSDYFFTEYRNDKDETLDKATSNHFRKFYKANYVTAIANENNFKCIYEIEGQGFAKWNVDDAFVTRQIYIKNGISNGR